MFNPTSTYALRVVPYTFNQQFATTETLNSEGYDPNNDNNPSTTKYTWQIQNIVLGKVLIVLRRLLFLTQAAHLRT